MPGRVHSAKPGKLFEALAQRFEDARRKLRSRLLPRSGPANWAILAAGFSVAALATPVLVPIRPLLIWNASASSPVGLYAVGGGKLELGQTVLAWAPPAARRLAARRHYLPRQVPLVKRVSALAGMRVCATGKLVLIDGRIAAVRKKRDPSGRALPWWEGCSRLRRGELFLLSPRATGAFDGRYFGITHESEVIGSARLIWPR
jgi:type IV secretory pathway protease TraF